MKGTFTLRASSEAEKIDYTALEENVKNTLCNGLTFDPHKHDIYRFFVIPEIHFESSSLPRKLKKKSLAKANRAIVQAERGSNEIKFLGYFPVTQDEDGQLDLDLEGKAIFEITVPGFFKTKLVGKTKNIIRRKSKKQILTSRTDEFVQWLFLKRWIEDGRELGMQIFCRVTKSAKPEDRYVICNAKYSQGNREIEKLTNRRIEMPI